MTIRRDRIGRLLVVLTPVAAGALLAAAVEQAFSQVQQTTPVASGGAGGGARLPSCAQTRNAQPCYVPQPRPAPVRSCADAQNVAPCYVPQNDAAAHSRLIIDQANRRADELDRQIQEIQWQRMLLRQQQGR